ncbi:MAG: MmgE/PrpD family protein [Ignavibacteriales bacterium]
MATALERLGRWVAGVRYEDLPGTVVEQARARILDSVGVALYGATQSDLGSVVRMTAARAGGSPESSILGSDRKAPMETAAFVNATLAHSMEYDDGHSYAGIHAGAVVVPSVLAVSEADDLPGTTALAATVAGYGSAYWLARIVNPSHLKRGFHTTGTLGPAAAAAAAGRLMGLPAAGVANAMALALLSGGGYMETLRTGQNAKGLVAGRASMLGVQSATLAGLGVVGPLSVIEGQDGFLRATCDSFDRTVLDGLPGVTDILDTYCRLWPVCRHAQPALHAAILARAAALARGLDTAGCRRVRVGTYGVAQKMCAGHGWPASVTDAKFSMEYLVSAGLLNGRLSPVSDLNGEALSSTTARELFGKVGVEVDPALEAEYPTKRLTRVTVEFDSGEDVEACSRELPGSVGNPLSRDDLVAKFVSAAEPLLGGNRSAHAAEFILNSFETVGGRRLAEILAPRLGE